MGKPDIGSVCLGGKLFTLVLTMVCGIRYFLTVCAFEFRILFWNTLRSKSVTVTFLRPYVPIGYVWYGMICVYVGSSYLGVVLLGSWRFARLLFDGSLERIVGRGQARQWVCLPRGQVVHLSQLWCME